MVSNQGLDTELPRTVDAFDEITVKKSFTVFVARIITLHVVNFISLLFFYILLLFVFGFDTLVFFFVTALFTTFLSFALTLYVYFRWKAHYYIIFPNAVVEKKGVFKKFEKSYACNRIESVTLDQSFIGRMLEFGTVGMYDFFLKKTIYITNIDKPQEIAEILKDIYVTQKEVEVLKTSGDDKVMIVQA